MNLETFELAHRAVTCKHWKWIPGMMIHNADGFVRIDGGVDGEPFVYGRCQWSGERIELFVRENPLPDLSDPATVGCLLDLVRKAWHTAPANVNCHMSYSPNKGHYRNWTCSYCTGESWNQTIGETEVEALVLALEASNG